MAWNPSWMTSLSSRSLASTSSTTVSPPVWSPDSTGCASSVFLWSLGVLALPESQATMNAADARAAPRTPLSTRFMSTIPKIPTTNVDAKGEADPIVRLAQF